MMSDKEIKVRKAMSDSGILDLDDAQKAIEFVRDLLEIDIEETELNEPHALNSIAEMRAAIAPVSNLTNLIEED